MVPKRPKFGLFFENFSLVVCLLCTPTNWPKTGGQIWGPSAFKTRQTVGETGSVGSARSSAELPHDSLRDFEGAPPAIRGRRPRSGLRSSLCRAQRGLAHPRMGSDWRHQMRLGLGRLQTWLLSYVAFSQRREGRGGKEGWAHPGRGGVDVWSNLR